VNTLLTFIGGGSWLIPPLYCVGGRPQFSATRLYGSGPYSSAGVTERERAKMTKGSGLMRLHAMPEVTLKIAVAC
jgi:hypothetical protein